MSVLVCQVLFRPRSPRRKEYTIVRAKRQGNWHAHSEPSEAQAARGLCAARLAEAWATTSITHRPIHVMRRPVQAFDGASSVGVWGGGVASRARMMVASRPFKEIIG